MAPGRSILLAFAISLVLSTYPAAAEKKYDPGATDSDIKIGNIMPYSGPLSAYALIARTQTAFFTKINAEGGINGRKMNFISYDDAFSPPKTVEQARKLVESDEVLLDLPKLGHTDEQPHSEIHGTKRMRRSYLLPPAPPSLATPRTFPGRWAGNRLTRRKGNLREIYLAEPSAGQDRHSISERTISAATISRASGMASARRRQSA